QTKLLRALQEGELSRLGGNRTIRVDVRVIAATNRDLAREAQAGRFREDLYFRIAVIPITVPPLRERADDVPVLVEHFAAQVAREIGQRRKKFSPAALETLARHSFPGNVRELRNLVERLVIMSAGAGVSAEDVIRVLPAMANAAADAPRISDAVHDFER